MEEPKVKPKEVKTDDIEIVSLLKPKREQSEKQKAVWAKAQQTRLDNAAAKREAITKNKDEKQLKREIKIAKALAKQEKFKPKIVESESEDEQEVIIVKKKKKTQPKIIYQEASSSEEEEEPQPPPTKPKSTKKVIKEEPQIQLPIKPVIRFF